MELKKNFTKVPNVIIWTNKLSKYAKLLFVIIASRNPSFPSYTTICKNMGVKNRSIISNAIKELVFFNILTYEKGNSRRSNSYKLRPLSEWNIEASHTSRDSSGLEKGLKEVTSEDSNNTNLIKIKNKQDNNILDESNVVSSKQISEHFSEFIELIQREDK